MSRFLSYIHNLRGAAIFFVVGVHARGNIHDWENNTTQHLFVSTIFDSREGNGTVMFLFIAGFLFQYLTQTKFEYWKYLEQKFKYVIIPYLLISIPLIIYRISDNFIPPGTGTSFNDQSVFYRFLYYIITGSHMAPFWFISAIVLFYISSPLLRALDKPVYYRFLFPIVFISCFFTYRPFHNANPILSFLHYFPIYYLGMWASHHRERILATSKYLFVPLIAAYIGISAMEIIGTIPTHAKLSFEQVVREGRLIFNLYILKAILLCFIMLMLLYKLRNRKMPLLEILGEYSFGVFFVHFVLHIVAKKTYEVLFGELNFSLLSFAIYFGFIVLASIAIVYSIKRLTGSYSRNLIGS
jgi:probable poly-beta-1,6-N-acetyl-D-glucosamine export protein